MEKDQRAQEIEEFEISRLEKNIKDQVRIYTEERNKKINDLLAGTSVTSAVTSRGGEKLLKRGDKVTLSRFSRH